MDLKILNPKCDVHREKRVIKISRKAEIIRILREGPATATYITKRLGGNPRAISTKLSEMCKEGIVHHPEAIERLRARYHYIYQLGTGKLVIL